MIKFGTVVVQEGYRNGKVVTRTRRVENSIPISSRQELLDNIFQSLRLLSVSDHVQFTVYANKHSHEPTRIVLVTEEPIETA